MKVAIQLISIALIACSLLAGTSQAYDPYWSMKGSTISGGSHYSDQTAFSATNPVAQQLQEPEGDWKATIALPYNVSAHYEVIDVSNAVDDVNVLVEDVAKASLSLAGVQSIKTKAEAILQDFESHGTIINGGVMTNGTFPVITLTHPDLQGTLTFEHQESISSYPAAFATSFTSAPLMIDPAACTDLATKTSFSLIDDTVADIQNCYNALSETQKQQFCPDGFINFANCDVTQLAKVFGLDSNASIDFRTAFDYDNYLLGYSKQVFQHASKDNHWASGVAFAGGKMSYTSVETAGTVLKLTELQNNKKFADLLKDVLSPETKTKSSGFGLDVGVSWLSQRYSASMTVNNAIAPEIEYSDGYIVKQDIAPSLGGILYLNESQSWSVRLQNDFAAIKNMVGAEYQWRIIGLSYTSTRWYLPGFEIAKRWNLAGKKIAYTALGLKLFDVFQMNVAVSDEQVSEVPRGGLFSLGFGFSL